MDVMNNEIITIEHSPNEQHHNNEFVTISNTAPDANSRNASEESKNNSKQWFCSRIPSSMVRFCMFAIFTSIAITVGVLTVYFTTPKLSTVCELSFKRMMKSSLITSSQPRSVAAADFNNDNNMDIIVANSGTNTIGIFISNGDGTFANQQTYSTGSQSRSYSIVVSDFNNDRHLDVAVANYDVNNIGIFLGNGNGTFLDQKLFSLGSSHPLCIATGDFNNDNQTDIVVANYGTNSVSLLLGSGNGSFQDQITYFTGYDSIPYSLVVGDFNKDNKLDIGVANYGTNNVGILLGNGNGTFNRQITYSTTPNSNPSSIALGDFNNDTHLDIIVANYGISGIGIFLNRGNGTFSSQTTYSTGSKSRPQFIAVGHFDNNTYLDVVVVDSENNRIDILPGSGNGNFAEITTYDGISGSRPFSTAVADFDNDNQSDIVVTNFGTNDILILSEYSIKPSTRQISYQDKSLSGSTSVAVGDFNGDHILDMVFNVRYLIAILTGVGNGTFDNEVTYSTGDQSTPQYVGVGDVNSDNLLDIVTANSDSDSVGVFLGHGDGTFAAVKSYSTGLYSSPYWVTLGDVNNDHRVDLISANPGTDCVSIIFGNGDGTFGTMANYSTGVYSAPLSVAVGNINNDSYLDIAVCNNEGTIGIFLGYGNGSFSKVNKFPTVGYPFSIALADFNSDNHLDIVVTNSPGDNIGVFLGYGDGTFATQATYATGVNSLPNVAIVADFNNDNLSDIAVTNNGNDEVVIFYGYGNGSFNLARTYPTGFGSHPYGIAAADLSNDKQLEIIVTRWGFSDIAVLTEYYAAEFADETLYSTGSAPELFSIATGDFNNDNRSDIVVVNSGTDNLGILLGFGNGTFDMETIYPIGTDAQPQYVITGDINKDNHIDIVSVNSNNNSISVITGYGNGTFAKQIMYSTGDGSYPYAIASGDLNNDNRLDFAIANVGTDNIGIFYGFNYTSFLNQETYSSNSSLGPAGIVVSDFNNDSYLDIAVVFTANSTLGILLGSGSGSFTNITIYSIGTGLSPYGMAVGDFNNDTRSDIIVTNLATNNIGVLLGYGNGSFTVMMSSPIGDYTYPAALAVADFNNDDCLDIVVVATGTNNIGVQLGYGNGTFSKVTRYSTGDRSNPFSVTVADSNNDSRLDIVVVYRGTNGVGVLLGYGDGNFGAPLNFSAGPYSNPTWVIVGDFNHDNRLDIVTSNWNTDNIGILLGYGNGTFGAVMTYSTGSGSAPYCIRAGDFNNDNKSDIAVANAGTNNIVVLFGFGDGSFLLGTAYSTGNESSPFALGIGDFNNDTQLDIAITNNLANTIGIFLAYSSHPFATMTTYSTGDESQPHSIAIGDLNNDGRLDIAVANYGTDNVGILLGYSSGISDAMMTYSTGIGSAPYAVAIGDFNNDHNFDIVVTNSETDNVAILLGLGNGTFEVVASYSTGARSRPYSVAIGDFDNDKMLDIVVTNSGTSNIFFLYGYGNGTFGNKTSYALGYEYSPDSIVVGDWNKDGWMDIAIACYNTDHIETLMKMC